MLLLHGSNIFLKNTTHAQVHDILRLTEGYADPNMFCLTLHRNLDILQEHFVLSNWQH